MIIFSFSKKECEALALQMQALELNNADEAALVDGVFWNAVDCLSEADRRLPQIGAILPMLKRGVGVHHSGLLPILKEVIEILFQEGLLKARPCCPSGVTGCHTPKRVIKKHMGVHSEGYGRQPVAHPEGDYRDPLPGGPAQGAHLVSAAAVERNDNKMLI